MRVFIALQARSLCSVWELLLLPCVGLSLQRPLLRSAGSRCVGFSGCSGWAWWLLGSSGAAAHRLSCSVAHGVFPDQGSNLCPVYWQVDSSPLRHQGCPVSILFLRLRIIFTTITLNYFSDCLSLFPLVVLLGFYVVSSSGKYSALSFYLTFCDCSFCPAGCRVVVLASAVCPVVDETKRLMQVSQWEGLVPTHWWVELDLVLWWAGLCKGICLVGSFREDFKLCFC